MVSKKVFSAVLVTAMVLSVIGGSTAAFAQQTMVTRTTTTTTTTTTITQTAQSTPDLSTLVKYLGIANLTGVLNESGNYTVLAPTNEAFAKLNSSTLAELQNNTTLLKSVLLYHVIPKKLLAANITGSGTVPTLNGAAVPYSVNGTKITFGSGDNTVTVTKADINATNGVVHVVDGVLIPPAGAAVKSTAAASPAAGAFGLPGFEAVYAVAGLLAVAYLVLRRRK